MKGRKPWITSDSRLRSSADEDAAVTRARPEAQRVPARVGLDPGGLILACPRRVVQPLDYAQAIGVLDDDFADGVLPVPLRV